jgi:hypothetical protein
MRSLGYPRKLLGVPNLLPHSPYPRSQGSPGAALELGQWCLDLSREEGGGEEEGVQLGEATEGSQASGGRSGNCSSETGRQTGRQVGRFVSA